MGRSEYIPWAPEEEARLLPFMKRHGHLPWEIIGEEYVRETGIPRKKHSLRGKVGQLQKGHRRQRPISQKAAELHIAAARRAARQWQRVSDLLPASPPPLSLKEPGPQFRRMLQQMRQLSLQTCPRYGASIANGIDHSPPRGAHRPVTVLVTTQTIVSPVSAAAAPLMIPMAFGRLAILSLAHHG
ncbi:uncharacterized protein N7469_001894 [Penicillium citrinum]|uniref:Myb-like domain-containing protein n=1 Tax=Penicillium citrinum TaxID=5077 RepID=A0A9W9P9D6_PENCI|nr:uncharacterized protein N7469_001894 [Penicillium citrinum]KAJ5240303.1 hypothetical protein N7469_001894 [Penicillium citrinum]